MATLDPRSAVVKGQTLLDARRSADEMCAHSFSDVAPLDLGDWGFAAQSCEKCGTVLLVHDEEPLATEDALRNAEHELDEFASQLEEAVEELAAFRAREATSLVVAVDRGWPAVVLVLALEEPPRFLATAQSDEAAQRLIDWLGRDEITRFLADLVFCAGSERR